MLNRFKKSYGDRPEVWVPVTYVVGVIVITTLMYVLVLGPSHRERHASCEAQGGVVVSDGSCIDRDVVIGAK